MFGLQPCLGGPHNNSLPTHQHLNQPSPAVLQSLPVSGPHAPFRWQHHAHQALQRRTTCMAHPRRMAKVSKQIEREIGSLFLSDEKMQRAVHPGRSVQEDDILPPITSVTEVRVSGDLSVAKVYVSVYGDEEEQAATLGKLSRLQGYVRKHIGSAMSLRMTPEIRFMKDEFIQKGEQVMAALDQVRLQREGKISPPPIAISRNVRAAVDRARAQEADEDANVRGGEDNADDDLELLLDDDDEDEDNLQENGGINLDDFFAREKQMAMAQQQPQQRPARSRRR